ncbi:MAG TPA: AI-2E family transporter [Stellaceae bacterium]|nr:AI-2E family transporter [Stellaceae bacterium]
MTTVQRNTWFWLVGFALFFLALWLLSAILLPFVAGIAIAYFLNPLVNRLEHLKVPRGLSAFIVLVLFLTLLVLVIMLVVPILEAQVLDLAANLPSLLAAARREAESLMQLAQERLTPEDFGKLRDAVGGKLSEMFTVLGTVFRDVVTRGVALANMLSLVFVTPVVSFFLLRDWNRILARLNGWLPRAQAATIREQAARIDEILSAYLRGQLSVCVVLGIYYAVGLTVLGLNFGSVIGLLIGILAFIPYVGFAVGFVLALLLALTQFSDQHYVLYVAALFVAGMIMEGNFLTPKLVGERVQLHPVWIVFALLSFGTLFGLLGVLIAVPMAAVIGVLVRFGLSRYLASPLYDPAKAKSEPGGAG